MRFKRGEWVDAMKLTIVGGDLLMEMESCTWALRG